MKRIIIILSSFFTFNTLFAQKAIDGVINAEKRFAKLATDKSIKEAFLANLDSEGVVFNAGNIVNGIKAYQKQTASKAKLLWDPAYSIISSSGDLAINTGPYQFFQNDSAINPIVQGHFSTVWHKTKNGEWKFLADMGIDYSTPVIIPVAQVIKKDLSTSYPKNMIATREELLVAEQSFIKNFAQNGTNAFVKVIAEDVWFNVEGFTPWVGKKQVLQKLANIPSDLVFTTAGYGISKSGDLGYVYGIVDRNNKQENYLRVWEHLNRQWILIFQTLLF
jgi:ketosteroid isomerase-like protein